MQRIVSRVVRAKECDTLLKVAEYQLNLADTALAAKDSVLKSVRSIVLLKEDIITGKDFEISGLRDALKIRNRKLKLGWLSSGVVLGAGLFWFVLN